MDPEKKRVNPPRTGADEDSTSRPGSRPEHHWYRRGHRVRRISPHTVFAFDHDGERFQWVRGARFASDFVPTESHTGDFADEAAWSRARKTIAGRTVQVSIPERLIIRRVFALPTRQVREVRTMLEHQLGPGLPVDLHQLQWSWRVVGETERGLVVLVELCRRDALEHHLAPLVEAGARVERAVPEGWLLAHRVRELTGADESSGLVLRAEGAFLVVQSEGRLLETVRMTAGAITTDDVDASNRRRTQEGLEVALERARAGFEARFGRALPEPTVVLTESEGSHRDHGVAVLVANGLGAEPAAMRTDDGSPPWRGLALAALTSTPGPSLHATTQVDRRRRRRVVVHAALLSMALTATLAFVGHGELRRLEATRDALDARIAAQTGATADLASMQQAVRDEARRHQGSHESLLALVVVQRHATNDFVLDRITYLAGEKIEIAGSARDVPSIVGFARKLENESIFTTATVRNLSEVDHADGPRVRFALEGRLVR